MDNRVLIGFVVFLGLVFLGLFLAFPFVAQVIRESDAKPATTATSAESKAAADPERGLPPMLNSQNIVGTEWKVRADNYIFKVTIAPNGVCYATHPLLRSVTGMDYIEGRWRIEYDKAYIEAHFGNQHLREVLTISGMNLYSGSTRIERY